MKWLLIFLSLSGQGEVKSKVESKHDSMTDCFDAREENKRIGMQPAQLVCLRDIAEAP